MDLNYALGVAQKICQTINDYLVAIIKSTILVGTAEKIRGAVGQSHQQQRSAFLNLDIA